MPSPTTKPVQWTTGRAGAWWSSRAKGVWWSHWPRIRKTRTGNHGSSNGATDGKPSSRERRLKHLKSSLYLSLDYVEDVSAATFDNSSDDTTMITQSGMPLLRHHLGGSSDEYDSPQVRGQVSSRSRAQQSKETILTSVGEDDTSSVTMDTTFKNAFRGDHGEHVQVHSVDISTWSFPPIHENSEFCQVEWEEKVARAIAAIYCNEHSSVGSGAQKEHENESDEDSVSTNPNSMATLFYFQKQIGMDIEAELVEDEAIERKRSTTPTSSSRTDKGHVASIIQMIESSESNRNRDSIPDIKGDKSVVREKASPIVLVMKSSEVKNDSSTSSKPGGNKSHFSGNVAEMSKGSRQAFARLGTPPRSPRSSTSPIVVPSERTVDLCSPDRTPPRGNLSFHPGSTSELDTQESDDIYTTKSKALPVLPFMCSSEERNVHLSRRPHRTRSDDSLPPTKKALQNHASSPTNVSDEAWRISSIIQINKEAPPRRARSPTCTSSRRIMDHARPVSVRDKTPPRGNLSKPSFQISERSLAVNTLSSKGTGTPMTCVTETSMKNSVSSLEYRKDEYLYQETRNSELRKQANESGLNGSQSSFRERNYQEARIVDLDAEIAESDSDDIRTINTNSTPFTFGSDEGRVMPLPPRSRTATTSNSSFPCDSVSNVGKIGHPDAWKSGTISQTKEKSGKWRDLVGRIAGRGKVAAAFFVEREI